MVAAQTEGFKHVPYYPYDTFILCTLSLSNFHFAATQDTHDRYVFSPFGQVALLRPFFIAPHFSLHDTMLCGGCQNQC